MQKFHRGYESYPLDKVVWLAGKLQAACLRQLRETLHAQQRQLMQACWFSCMLLLEMLIQVAQPPALSQDTMAIGDCTFSSVCMCQCGVS